MEAKSIITRQCASRAIKNIVWNVNDSEKKKLKKAQLPHLPTLTTQYKTYLEALDLIHTTDKDILVVGDGNLSFGRALSRLFGSPKTKQTLDRTLKKKQLSDNIDYGARNIVVTCYESAMASISFRYAIGRSLFLQFHIFQLPATYTFDFQVLQYHISRLCKWCDINW